MKYVVGNVCRAEYKVTYNAAVIGYLIGQTESAVQVERGSHGVAGRANTTDALSIHLGVARVSAAKYYFKATEHHARAMSLFDHTFIGDNFNFVMSFETGNRVNNDLAQFLFLLSR